MAETTPLPVFRFLHQSTFPRIPVRGIPPLRKGRAKMGHPAGDREAYYELTPWKLRGKVIPG